MPGTPGPDIFIDETFPRVHQRALGIALGVTTGVALFLLTILEIAVRENGLRLGLLSQYFYGYNTTWPGAFIGLVWGVATGFVAGWLLAAVRNVTASFWLLLVRTKCELSQKRNILDHLR